MEIIKRSEVPSIADGFSSKDESWFAIFAAFTGGLKRDKSYMLSTWLQIPDWGNRILQYMFGVRDSVSEDIAFQALDEGIASGDLIQTSTSTNTSNSTSYIGTQVVQVSVRKLDYQEFLLRLKLDTLSRNYGYRLKGGIDIQSMAELLPENLSIGIKTAGLGSLIISQSTLDKVKSLTAEAQGDGSATSLTDSVKTEETMTTSEWLSANAMYVGIAAIVILAVAYYKWVR